MRRSLTFAPLIAACSIAAAAQSPPPRPALPATADTNDVEAYLAWGKSKLQKSPADAAAAFYWASRLDPARPGAYYARWVALQLTDKSRFAAHYERKKSTLQSSEVLAVDSIQLRSIEFAPLEYRDLDAMIVGVVYSGPASTTSSRERLNTLGPSTSGVDPNQMAPRNDMPDAATGAVYRQTNAAPSASASIGGAWSQYAHSNFQQALHDYGAALNGAKAKWAVYAERGRIFAITKSPDSALAQFALAIGAFPNDPDHEQTYVYESVAIDEHMRGLVHESLQHADSARAAYQRALDADPSYAPAHLRLATLDLAKGDTTAALSHFDLAAQVRPGDGVIAYQYGFLLIKSGHDAEALEQLERASQLEPFFAAPRFLAAAVYDAHDMKPKAVASYTSYLTLAAKRDPLVARAKERLAALQ